MQYFHMHFLGKFSQVRYISFHFCFSTYSFAIFRYFNIIFICLKKSIVLANNNIVEKDYDLPVALNKFPGTNTLPSKMDSSNRLM